MKDVSKDLISVEQVAARLGLLRTTVRDAVDRGYLTPERVTAHTLWFRPDTVDRYGRILGRPSFRGA
jgi:hypothetical protein